MLKTLGKSRKLEAEVTDTCADTSGRTLDLHKVWNSGVHGLYPDLRGLGDPR